jgi:hypothetical protein
MLTRRKWGIGTSDLREAPFVPFYAGLLVVPHRIIRPRNLLKELLKRQSISTPLHIVLVGQ